MKKLQRNLLLVALLCTVLLTSGGLLALHSGRPEESSFLFVAQAAAQQSPLSAAQQSPLTSPGDTSDLISTTTPVTATPVTVMPAITTTTGVTTVPAFTVTDAVTIAEGLTASVTISTTGLQDEASVAEGSALTETLVLTDIGSSVVSPLPTPEVVSPTHTAEMTTTSLLTNAAEVDATPTLSASIESSEPLSTEANLPESPLAPPATAEPPSAPPSVIEDPIVQSPRFFEWLPTINIAALVHWGQTLINTGQLSLLLVGLLFAAFFTMMGIVFLRH